MSEIEERETTENELSLVERVKLKMSESGFKDEASVKCYVHRREGNSKLLLECMDYVPEIEHMSKKYGQGKYSLSVHVIDENGKYNALNSYSWTADKIWGEGTAYQSNEQPQPIQQIQQPSFDMDKIIAVISTGATIIKPLIESLKPDPQQKLQEFQMMNNIMERSMLNNMNNMQEMMDRQLEHKLEIQNMITNGSTQPPDENEPTQIEAIIQAAAPLVEQFLPNLLGTGGKALVPIVKASAQYKEIMQAEGGVEAFKEFLTGEYGIETAKKAFDLLKIE